LCANCSIFQLDAVRFTSLARTFNPKAAGSNPARPIKPERTRESETLISQRLREDATAAAHTKSSSRPQHGRSCACRRRARTTRRPLKKRAVGSTEGQQPLRSRPPFAVRIRLRPSRPTMSRRAPARGWELPKGVGSNESFLGASGKCRDERCASRTPPGLRPEPVRLHGHPDTSGDVGGTRFLRILGE
jgi:hypothetical protein